MAVKRHIYKTIENAADITSAMLLVDDITDCDMIVSIKKIIKADFNIVHINEDIGQSISEMNPDVVFFRSGADSTHDKIVEIANTVRESGYEGIFLLITEPITNRHEINTLISNDGYDSYIFLTDSFVRVQDAINCSILGRKRKVKYNICFDDSLDSFFTINAMGTVYDTNEAGTKDTAFSPREVVKRKISIRELGKLEQFDTMILPLITEANIDKVFKHIVEETSFIYQLKTKIQNAPTIGLVATIVKTDITKIIYTNTLDLLVNSITLLSQRDNYTAGHSARVFYYAMYFMHAHGFRKSRQFSRGLYFGALLHDIGKIGIRDHVLLKNSKLSSDESNLISQHPQKGYKMLQRYEFLSDSLDIILSHHERDDGLGYPNKLKGDEIPHGASIISLIDGFDAMTTDRPYRKALSFEIAYNEIKKNIGTQYNKDVGGEFLNLITPTLVGDIHELAKKPLEDIANELVETILRD